MEPIVERGGVPGVTINDPLLAAPGTFSPQQRAEGLGAEAQSQAMPRFDLETGLIPTGRDFHEFYRDHRRPVGRALAVTIGDIDLATDSVDEAMVRALQRWDRVSVLDNPAGWVYRVGLNYARSGIRRRLRRPKMRPDGVIVGMTDEPMIDDPAIAAALASLSVDHRSVVVCRHLFGWSERETADALDVRPGTVKSRLSRALTNLEAALIDHRPEGQEGPS